MISFISDAIKEMSIFLIIITIIENLVSDSIYKKYIKLFSGLVIIIIILVPIKKIINSDCNYQNYFEEESMKKEISELDQSLSSLNENICNQSIQRYQDCVNKKIKEDLENEGYHVEYVNTSIERKEKSEIQDIENNEDILEIKNIKICIQKKESEKSVMVDKVIVGKQDTENDIDSKFICDYLVEKYEIDPNIVNVIKNT